MKIVFLLIAFVCGLISSAKLRDSYGLTCRNVTVTGTWITAECRRMDGSWIYSSIDRYLCGGRSINNTDGTLTC
jgi:hypothetical protein